MAWTHRRGRLRLSNAAGLVLIILLLAPGAVVGRTAGVAGGDTAVFSYQIVSTTRSPFPTLPNNTNTFTSQFAVSVLSVNTSASLGYFTYTLTVEDVNGTTESTSNKASNATTFLEPWNNDSYLGVIGFYPFTYTDLPQGKWTDLEIYAPLTGIPGVNASQSTAVQRLNASVARTSGLIKVNYTLYDLSDAIPIPTEMLFNASTGVLQHATTTANAFNVEKIFTYNLVSYDHPAKLDLSFLWYVALAAVIVFVVYNVATRKSRRERKVERIRKKMERAG